jgi:glycosyltransferase involved in cell wall biosynthesis
MMDAPRHGDDDIWIVLATFNAGPLLDPQIESIRAQTHTRWRLLIRDDSSSDDTARRLALWARRDPRITLLSDQRGRLGTRATFSLLLQAAVAHGAAWVALSDQDDVWLPAKLERLRACVAQEGLRQDRPALVHSDLEVVDPHLAPLHPSLFSMQGLRHEDDRPLPTLLLQNFVTGCTCLASRALLDFALPVPEDAVMHDWWLALCAASVGRLAFVPEATVRYRQHATSQIGAKDYRRSVSALPGRVMHGQAASYDELLATIRQTRALEARLLERRVGREDAEARQHAHALVARYLALYEPTLGRVARIRGLHRLGVRRQDWLRNLTLTMKLLTVPLPVSAKSDEDPGGQPQDNTAHPGRDARGTF